MHEVIACAAEGPMHFLYRLPIRPASETKQPLAPGALRYNPLMGDHRTAWEQVKSGSRIGSLIVLAFCFFVALAISLAYVTGKVDPSGGRHPLLGALAAAALVAIMFRTTQYWAKWLAGILALGALRILGALLFKAFYDLPLDFSLSAGLTWFAYLLVALALTARHASRRPCGLERVGLVCFVVSVALATPSGSPVSLFYGLGLLAVTEMAQRFLSYRRHRGRLHTPELTSSV
jgi:hypothetical protein